MGLARIKKVQIIGHKEKEKDIIEELAHSGMVQITPATLKKDIPFSEEKRPSFFWMDEQALQARLSHLETTINYLENWEKKTGLMGGLFKEKISLREKDFFRLAHINTQDLEKEAKDIQEQLSAINVEEEHLSREIGRLSAWSNLNLPLKEIRETKHIGLYIGIIPRDARLNLDGLKKELGKNLEGKFHLEVINEEKKHIYLVIIYLKEEEKKLPLAKYNFTAVAFPQAEENLTVRDYLEKTEASLSEISKKRKSLIARAHTLSREKLRLMVQHDYLLNQRKAEELKGIFLHSTYFFVLEGWIKERDIKNLENNLRKKFPEIEMLARFPKKDEEPPIILSNPPGISPFETITQMYGLPHSREVDPTPVLTPFFACFFALCLTDAGYGIILAILTYILLRRLRPSAGGKKLLLLLLIGGLATIFAGAITGGWFGDMFERLPFPSLKHFKDRLMLFDPMKQPLIFFGIALILGFVQICTGIIMHLYNDLKNGLLWQALANQLSRLVLMFSVPLFLLMHLGYLPASGKPFALTAFIISAFFIFLSGFFSTKGLIFRLFIGGYTLYSVVVGYLISDILSYSRLLALGMATTVIAVVVNTMGSMVKGIPFIGIILMIIVLITGHTFSIFINSLGAFVHTTRLQFAEFFTKFFEGGGKPFQPFTREYKYLSLK